jgi:hypothetical protein
MDQTAAGFLRTRSQKETVPPLPPESDVVRWATQKPDYEQQSFKLDYRAEDRTMCVSTWGACE